MVCASKVVDQNAERSAIAGGFVLIPIASLMTAWKSCRCRPLGIGDLRTWLATHEMQARRCMLDDGRGAAYTAPELAGLLGVTHKRAAASLRRLEGAGLIGWSESAIRFPDPPDDAVDDGLGDTIGRGRGSVVIPRRMLRHLAEGARPALIATALGILLRCLSRRRGGFDGRGRVKAGWIARVFGVSPRQVKAARRELATLGWIAPEPADQWAMNRWGRAYRIDLGWSPSAHDGSRSTPPPAGDGATLALPDLHQEPLQERINDQEPSPAGPAGVQSPGIKHRTRTSPVAGPLPPPRLDDVRVEDLKDTGRLLDLHVQAVAQGVVTASEADKLRFIGAAEHALAIGESNPAGLFAYLVRRRLWRYLRASDEDHGNARLKAHYRPTAPPDSAHRFAPIRPESRAPSDAEIVRSVRAAAIRAGIFRDPWPAFQRLSPGWDRARWDRAMEG
jgi:hypothetical protein